MDTDASASRPRRRRFVAIAIATAIAALTCTSCKPAVPTALISGGNRSCVLYRNGTAKCWGYGESGELGYPTSPLAYSTVAKSVVGLSGATSISIGSRSTCAVLSDGTATCWGSNAEGQLGDGTTTDSSAPVPVIGLTNIAAFSAGLLSACAVRVDGTAACWGDNSHGQLGNGTTSPDPTPLAEPVTGLVDAISIVVGTRHSCAVRTDATVTCWGWNHAGQLGNGTTTDSTVPVPVVGLTDVKSVALGYAHTCALLVDGTVRCWGVENSGRLGTGAPASSTVIRSTPVVVPDLVGVTSLTAGNDGATTCASLADGTAQCWGSGRFGTLGNGAYADAIVPSPVSGLTTVRSIASDTWHGCALLEDATVKCWGFNDGGSAGDGTTNPALTPVAVIGL